MHLYFFSQIKKSWIKIEFYFRAPILFRKRIVILRDIGLSYREISRKLYDEGLVICQEPIRNICEKYDETG